MEVLARDLQVPRPQADALAARLRAREAEHAGVDGVLAAAARIAPHATVTPVLRSRELDAQAGASLHFKAEHLQRSADPSTPPGADASVYLADTIGELGLWYRLAPVALVGGSFASVGGHNPHEPLALGCAVLHGPHVWNFAESYQQLDAAGLSQPVADDAGVERAVEAAWAGAATTGARPPEDGRAAGVLEHLLGLLPR